MQKVVAEHEVVVVGGGPTGLMLAGELALAGIDVAVVEKRLSQTVEGSRASGLHPRSLEVLDQRGIVEGFVSQGQKHHVVVFAGSLINASDRPTRHNYTLGLWQEKIEQELLKWVTKQNVPVYRGEEVIDFQQDETGVQVLLQNDAVLKAKYLAGCDGGRSIIRKKAGIDFSGWDADISYLIFEADMAEEPPLGMRNGERGVYALGRLDEGDRIRGVVTEPVLKLSDKPTIEELKSVLLSAYKTDFGLHNVTWLSRFTDAARQAKTYRQGRVLLAGDAAHVHSPVGGQGLNIGIQDAVNLGWKLAQVVKGVSSESLLDTYHEERHPVGRQLLKTTLALTALNRGDDRSNALREMMADVMSLDEARRWYTSLMSGLDIRYNVGDGHPLLGRRMPDLEIRIDGDDLIKVFTLLHKARPTLINFSYFEDSHILPYAEKIVRIEAHYEGKWELPVIGEVLPPHAVLVRPDGHVVWVGITTQKESNALDDFKKIIQTWF